MSEQNAIGFLQQVASRADLLPALMTLDKDDVLALAARSGFTFTEDEFDASVWDLEGRLAARRQEAFDGTFPLWETMWGKYYLEYLVTDLVPALAETGLIEPWRG